MSKLEELIQELCPKGVEYRKIGEICNKITDYTAAGSFADVANNVSYINDRRDYARLVRTTDLKSSFQNEDKFVYVNEHAFSYLWRVNLNEESIVLPNVGNCGEVYYVTPNILPDKNNVLGPNAILLISDTVNLRFLYHVFQNEEFQQKLFKITSSTGQTKFNKTNLKKLSVPIPPLEIQQEIVRILDTMTNLTAELTAELTARKKQYEYYRDMLLKFGDDVEWKAMNDIATFTYGYTDIAKDNGTARFIRITDINSDGLLIRDNKKYVNINEENEKYLVKFGDLLMARTGATYGKTLFINDIEPSIYASFLIKLNLNNDQIMNRYYWHFSKSGLYWDQANKLVTTGGQPQFNANALKKVLIPVPPLETQQKIVDILDRFDVYCNDITTGLPAEIEARQKQYEYYRNKLLTFKEL